jgi:hypothetical protein
MAMTLLSNNPVVLMFLPDRIYFQEIKLTNNQGGPSKAKIQDIVATRHPSSSSSSTQGGEKEDITIQMKTTRPKKRIIPDCLWSTARKQQ